jgi:hypothetical protein
LGGITLQGEGSTQITCANPYADGFYCVLDLPIHFSRLSIVFYPGQVQGAAIVLTGGSTGLNTESTFDDLLIAYSNIGIDFSSSARWHMNRCSVAYFNQVGAYVRDMHAADAGDSEITGCYFSGYAGRGTCVLQESGGGLRIISTKLGAGAYGYVMNLEAAAQTGDLLISATSIENQSVVGIVLSHQGQSIFWNVTITGSEFSGMPAAIQCASNGQT